MHETSANGEAERLEMIELKVVEVPRNDLQFIDWLRKRYLLCKQEPECAACVTLLEEKKRLNTSSRLQRSGCGERRRRRKVHARERENE